MDVNSFVIGYTKGKQSASGGGSGGGAELNIAYGDTPPEDTTKLWVKTSEVENIEVVTSSPLGDENYSVSTLKTVLPANFGGIAAASVGSKIYLFGGMNYDTFKNTNEIRVFDPQNNTVKTLSATVPTAANGLYVFADGENIYIAGDGTTAIHVFNTNIETISTLSSGLGIVSKKAANGIMDGVIYLLGGMVDGSVNYRIYKFNTKTGTFATSKASFQSSIYGMGCASVGRKMYLFGGNQNGEITTIRVFNTENETLSTLSTKLPRASIDISAVALGDKIYLLGGMQNSIYSSSIQVFDTRDNSLKEMSVALPVGLRNSGVAAFGEKIYLFGGGTSGSTAVDTINVFSNTPIFDLTKNHLLVVGSINIDTTEPTPSITIVANDVYVGTENNESEKVQTAFFNGEEWETI